MPQCNLVTKTPAGLQTMNLFSNENALSAAAEEGWASSTFLAATDQLGSVSDEAIFLNSDS